MRIVRYLYKNEEPAYGWVFENKVGDIEGNIFGEYRRLEAEIPLESVKLLAPRSRARSSASGGITPNTPRSWAMMSRRFR